MSYRTELVTLRGSGAGIERSLRVHRFGTPGARPKVYVQAALHANEAPTVVVAHHLVTQLIGAQRRGELLGEVIVVPAANPIGLSDTVLGMHMGRHALASGANFNRGFPDLARWAQDALDDALTQDAAHNTALIRSAMRRALSARQPRTELESLRFELLKLSCDADYVFDLHTEEAAVFAAVLAPWTVGQAATLVGDLQPDLVFHADYPQLFDTVNSRPWADLRQRLPQFPIEQACLSATLELRGCADIDDDLARDDAARLLRFLMRVGCVAGDPGELPPLATAPMRFEGVEFVRTPVAGVVIYRKQLGDRIARGDLIAEVLQPYAEDTAAARVAIVSGTAGVLFGRRHTAVVQADDVVAKVAGPEPLPDPKHY